RDVVAAGQHQPVDPGQRLLDGHRGIENPRLASDVENRLPVILELAAGGNTDDSHNYIRPGTSMPMRSRARVSCARTYATLAARQRFRSTRSSLRIGYRWWNALNVCASQEVYLASGENWSDRTTCSTASSRR